jgi:polar amino acid transport system permease protein
MTWDFGAVTPYIPRLFDGAITTIVLTILVLIVGMATGLLLAFAKMSRLLPLRWAAFLWIDFFRTTPPMVQIIWCYFVLPLLIGLSIDSFAAVVIALGLNTGAFASEIFRAGIQSVPQGQRDAARVLGLSRSATFGRIIGPQALRTSLPPLAVLAMLTVKSTSLASVLAVLELTTRGQLIAQATFRPIEVFSFVGIAYFLMIYPLGRLSSYLERRMHASDRTSLAVH